MVLEKFKIVSFGPPDSIKEVCNTLEYIGYLKGQGHKIRIAQKWNGKKGLN